MPGDERTRILFINHWARQLGGAEHSLLDIIEETAHRADVFLVTSESGALADRASARGAACTVVSCPRSLSSVRRDGLVLSVLRQWRAAGAFLGFVWRVRRRVRDIRPHLVHANVPKSHMTVLLLSRLRSAPVCCCHMREIFKRYSAPYLLYALLFRPANARVIAISNAVKESLPRAMKRQALVMYNGVAVPPRPETATKPGCPLRFVYLGRVVPWKGCHLLIEAFSRVYRKKGAAAGTLDIIGGTLYWSESYREELSAAIGRLGLGGACRLLPHTEEPLEVLRRHDVFCCAADREPFGRTVAEAQGCGLPVIAFAGGGIGEIVVHGETGIIVSPGDTAAFADAMEVFIDAPEKIASLAAAAHQRAFCRFNRSTQVPAITDFLLRSARARD